MAELAEQFRVHHLITPMEAATAGTSRRCVWWDEGSVREAESQDAVREDRATVLKNDFLTARSQGLLAETKAMIDRTQVLSIIRVLARRPTIRRRPWPMLNWL